MLETPLKKLDPQRMLETNLFVAAHGFNWRRVQCWRVHMQSHSGTATPYDGHVFLHTYLNFKAL